MGLPSISSRATWWEHRAELPAESPGLLRGAGDRGFRAYLVGPGLGV